MDLRRIIILSLVGIFVALVPAPAGASNWLGFFLGSDRYVDFRQCNLTTSAHDAFHWNDDNNVEPNAYIYTAGFHSCLEEQVELMDNGYGDTSWLGRWYCQAPSRDAYYCDYGNVQFNLDKQPSGGWTTTEWRHLMCHEVGHAMTLAHSQGSSEIANSCMGGPGTIWLTSHDHQQLNSVWSSQPG